MSLPAQAASADEDELVDVSGLIGRVLADRYRVTGLLGVGGIGRVYLAEHLVLKRPVALKVLLEHYQCVPDLQRRFEREAMALAALSHPNIVSIIDYVSTRELTFLVMELVDGRDLDEVLEEEGCLPPEDAFEIMSQILSSLAYAHRRDVIHRDLKPGNVLVQDLAGGRKHAVILDFGLAKFMDGSGPSANLTKTGLIVGTPAYMAPEQASGAHADQRADVYAAGVMLYEMLTGEHPFDGEGQELVRQHLLKPAPTLAAKARGAVVAPELEAIIERALAKDGSDRYADGGAMLDALLALPPDAYVPGPDATGRARSARAASRAATAIAASRAATAIAKATPASPSAEAPRPRGRGLGWVLAATILGAAILGSTWMVLRDPGLRGDPRFATAVGLGSPGADPAEPSEAEPAATHDGQEPTTEAAVATAGASADSAASDAASDDDDDASDDASDEGAADDEATDALAEDGDATAEDAAADAEAAALDEAEAPAEEPGAARVEARNPWRRGVPRELASVRRRVARNQSIATRHLRAVSSYRREHPDDVRAALLTAQVYLARGQAVRALNVYERAYRRDMSARGDPRMRRDLIVMASSSALHARATDAIAEIYGAEAVDGLTRAIGRARDAEVRARLQATLARVQP